MIDRDVTTTIDEACCTGCGLCADVCPKDTIRMQDNKAVVTGPECLQCGHCLAVCPTGAVQVGALDPALSTFNNFDPKASWLPFGEGDIRDLVQVMQSRRSCRSFRETHVPRDVLEDLVKIGITAPSGSNCQAWTFTVLPDRRAVEGLARGIGDFFRRLNRTAEKAWLRKGLALLGKPELEQYYENHHRTVSQALQASEEEGRDRLFHGAPAAIVVGSKKDASCPAEDALLATQNMLLAAHVLGLGTCLIGFAVRAMTRDRSIPGRIGMPDDETPYAVIALGYPKETYRRLAGRTQALVRYSRPA